MMSFFSTGLSIAPLLYFQAAPAADGLEIGFVTVPAAAVKHQPARQRIDDVRLAFQAFGRSFGRFVLVFQVFQAVLPRGGGNGGNQALGVVYGFFSQMVRPCFIEQIFADQLLAVGQKLASEYVFVLPDGAVYRHAVLFRRQFDDVIAR